MHQWLLRALAALALTLVLVTPARAWEPFVVEDIEIEGAERISIGTVLNYLPVRTGERFAPEDARRAIRALYDTGLFEDVELGRRDGALIVRVRERPAITEINFEGSFGLDEQALRSSLSDIGLARGRTFNRSLLEQVEQELRRQTYARGKYGMELSTEVRELDRNRVAIDINLREGKTARIRQINIIGNEAFDDEILKDLMESGIPSSLALLSSADEYSRAKLEGDLEAIRSHYLDRGYLRFSITSSQITITPDKKDIYITLNLDEGERYRIRQLEITGELPVSREELESQLQVSEGDLFSRKAIGDSRNAIGIRLAAAGYAFANIDVVPDIDDENQQVDVRFVVDPGKRAYVRRITFSGHTATEDQVYRRELRQLEGARFSPQSVERSQVRLQRLPQVLDVRVQTQRIPGADDQVDIDYEITERATGQLSLGLGYSSAEGAVFNIGVRQQNLFGTGRDLEFSVDNTDTSRRFIVRYTNPYYTDWGVSRSLRLSYQETDPTSIFASANYFRDSGNVGIEYGVPISEYETVSMGLGVDATRIRTTDRTPQEVLDYLDENGNEFGFLEGTLAYARDSRNRTVFAERGTLSRLSAEAALPGSDLEFYTLRYQFERYTPLTDSLVATFSGDIGYGAGYGETDALPFFRRYYAGGIRSVRGYQTGSLGPRYPDGEATGGDLRTTGSVEFVFPPPYAGEGSQARLSVFYDFGNVYASASDFEASELRSAIGLAFNWRSPLGPLSFSVAEPIDPEPEDETERFQFTIGTLF